MFCKISQWRVAFEANNVGVALLRSGHFARALTAFRNAMGALDLSTKSNPTFSGNEQLSSKKNLLVYPFCESYEPSSVFVQPVELEELASVHGFLNANGTAYAISVRDIPESHGDLDLHVASVIYNYALCHLLCCVHNHRGEIASRYENRLLQGARKLFGFARFIAV